ncbi:transcription intermediary factor 1-beta-like [Lytechinus variegatus]|uniref:transcription intermediary factor 1-beta-like n=1 Tax=Lytechinus variegatus TaxID=7654 RepID=UPI001BB2AD79|nr:transcription intermediary factor 1-beta-like [Lytechinus variegatus]
MASAFDNPVAPSTCDQCGKPAEDTVGCSIRDSKNLCRPCFRDLPKREDIGEPEWVCDIHATRKVEIFCESCDIGCCKECAGNDHNDHKVVNVVKLIVEIRQRMLAQLEEVDVSGEVLSEQRNKVNGTMNKIEEPRILVEKVVGEIKEVVQGNLDKVKHQIEFEAQLSITEIEKQRDIRLKLAKKKADHDVQRMLEIQQEFTVHYNKLSEDEKWLSKMKKTEATLLEREHASVSAKLEIKSMLEASPEKIIRRGRHLISLVETSSAYKNDQMDISASCKKVEADIPECEVNIEDFFTEHRPFRGSTP